MNEIINILSHKSEAPMKKGSVRILSFLMKRTGVACAILLSFSIASFGQTTFTWNGGNGNWGVAGNWVKAGASTSTWPGQNANQNDIVIINSTGTVTINQNFNNNSVQNVTVNTGTLTSNAQTCLINGNLLIANGSTFNINQATLNVSGTTTVNGILSDGSSTGSNTFNGLVTISNTGSFTNANNSVFNFGGGITSNGTLNQTGTGAVTFTASQALGGTGTIAFAGGLTLGAGITLSSTVSNLSFNGTTTCSTGVINASAGTITYSAAATNIFAGTYNNLTINGAATLCGNITVNGTLTINGSLNTAGYNVGITSVACGTGTINATAGTITYSSATSNIIAGTYTNLTIANGVTATLCGNTTVSGLLIINGAILNIGTYTLSAASFTKTNLNTINISTGTLSVTGNMALLAADAITFSGTGNLNVTGNLTNGAVTGNAATINVGGNFMPSTFTVGTSTVNCNGAGTQTIGAFAYYNLRQTGTGTVRLNGVSSVTNAFTFSSGTVDCQNNNLTLSGTITYTGGTFLPGTSTVTYGGASFAQDIIPANYATLTISNTGTHTLDGNTTVSGAFAHAGTLNSAYDLTLNGTVTCGGSINATAGTVTYASTATSIILGTYNNLVSNGASLCGNTTVGGTISLTSGALNINNFLLTLNGAVAQTSGTLTGGGTSDITFGGAGASTSLPTVSGGIRNLTLNRANGIALSGDNSVSNQLTLTSGRLTLGAYNLTLGASAPAVAGTLNATNMIVADGTGQLKKVIPTTGLPLTYVFPIGDNTVTAEYSPISLTFTANSTQRTIGARVTDTQHPSDGTTNNYLSRYWSFTDDAAGTYTYNATFTGLAADQAGVPTQVNRWDGSVWTSYTTTGTVPVFTITGQTQATSLLNNSDFTERINPTTYTWNVANGAWTAAGSWTPNRTTPAATDILIFDGGTIPTATTTFGGAAAFTETEARIIVKNNANVTLQSTAAFARTITISGGNLNNLDIQSGSTLQLGVTAGTIALAFTGTQNVAIAGNLTLNASSTYTATNSNTIVTGTIRNNGGTITSTAANLIFNSGGTYNHAMNSGTIPTATWNAGSNCNIITGFTGTAPIGLTQNFSNFGLNCPGQTLTLANSLNVGGNLNITAGTLSAGAITINIGGTFTNSGTFNAGTGTVNYNGTGAQTITALNYYNLTIGNSARTVTLANAGTIGVGGVFTPNVGPTYVTTGSTINYNSALTQNIATFNYNNLTVTGGSGVAKTLVGTTAITGNLALDDATVVLSNYDLTVGGAITTVYAGGFDVSHMIVTNGTGDLIKQGNNGTDFTITYPVGSASHYTPMVISALSATVAAGSTLSVRAVPAQREPLTSALKRYWAVAAQNITSLSAIVKFTYDATDIAGVVANYATRRFDGSVFQNVVGGSINTTTRELSSSGTTILDGDWTAIDPSSSLPTITGPTQVFQNRTQVYTTQAGMTGYTWSVTGGTINASTIPNTNSLVVDWGSSTAGTVSVSYTQGSTVYTLPVLNVTINVFPSTCFQYRQRIDIAGGMVNGGPHANFPVMISVSSTNFKSITQPTPGHMTSELGYDIYFASDAAGTTRLEHQLDTYDPTTGALVAWVNIPSLTNAGTSIYMFYGNNTISFDASTASIWSSDYVGVYHLGQSVQDFGRAGNDGINSGTSVDNASKIGKGRVFVRGNKSFIQLENELAFNFHTGQTVSFWIKINSFSTNNWGDYLNKGDLVNWRFVTDKGNARMFYSFGTGGAGDLTSANNAVTAGTGNWYYVVGTFNSGTKSLYINTVLTTNNPGYTDIQTAGMDHSPVLIGVNPQATDDRAFDGTMDELRISNIAKTTAWLTTEYRNQSVPATYITLNGGETNVVASPTGGGTANASPTTLFAREYTTLTLTGYTGTIQWQSSSDNITFTDMAGKTAASFATDPILASTWFRAKVTNGSCPALSTTVKVTATAPYLSCSSGHRKRITLNKAFGSDDLINFPVLLRITGQSDLATTTNGGIVSNANGYDIRFAASDGYSLLSEQVESYNPVNGDMTVWVTVPKLSASTTTDIYLYYGDASLSSDPSSSATWSSEYAGVWHMGTSGLTDATSNGTTATNTGTTSTGTGFINQASVFNGSSYITLNNESKFDVNTGLTVSAWVYSTGYGAASSLARFIDKGGSSTGGWSLKKFKTAATDYRTIFFQQYQTPTDTMSAINSTGIVANATPTWHYLVGTFDNSINSMIVFIDGSPAGSLKNDPANGAIVLNNNTNVRFGADAANATPVAGSFLTGGMDEIRIQNVARSVDWVRTEYDNQRTGSTFYTIATDATCSAGAATAGTATATKTTLCTGQTTFITLAGYTGGIYWQSSADNLNWSYMTGQNAASVTVGPITQTMYYRAAVSKCCEVYSNVITISYKPTLPPALSFSVTNTTCNGNTDGAIDLTVSQGVVPYNYTWSNAAITQDISLLAPATYTVTVADANACSTVGSATVSQPAVLTSGTIGIAQNICNGSAPSTLTEIVAPTGGTGTYTYQWQISTDNVTFTNIPLATLSSYSPGALATDTWYRRNVTSTPCGTQSSASIKITVNTVPTITLGTNPSVCTGTTSATLSYSATTGSPNQYSITYDLTATGAGFANVPYTALSAGSITLSVPGAAPASTYNGVLTVRNSATGCVSANYPITVGVNSSAVAPTSASSDRDAFCSNAGGNISLSVTGGSGTTVRWFTGICAGTVIGTGNPLSIAAPTATTTYYARWENGCGNSACASVTVTVYPLPTVSITSSNAAMCFNATRTLTGTPAGGTFTILGTSTATGTISGANLLTITGGGTLNIQYSYTDGVTGCSNTDVQAINAYGNLIAGTAGSDQTICNGDTPSPLSETLPTGGDGTYTYNWQQSIDGGSTWGNASGTRNGQNYTPGALTATTLYRRQDISGSSCGTQTSNNVTINVPAALSATLASTNVTCNGANDGTITISAPLGGYGTYEYSTNGGTTWQASGNFTALANATYNVMMRDAAHTACTKTLNAALVITQPVVLSAGTIGSIQTICYNIVPASLTETGAATGGAGIYTYQWQNSSDDVTFTDITGATQTAYAPGALIATNYYRRNVTSGTCGTVSSASVKITVNPLPAITLGSVASVCQGINSFSLPYTATTESPTTYSITAGTPAVSGFVTVTNAALGSSPIGVTIPSTGVPANTYQFNIIVTNGNGCVSTNQTFNLIVTPLPTTGPVYRKPNN